MRWSVLENAEEVAKDASAMILDAAEHAINSGRLFSIVLAGGGTPELTYSMLAQESSSWDRWAVYFGDERCLPENDLQRNSVMARASFLDRVPIPSSQIYSIPAQLGPQQGACLYAETIKHALPFDLVILGLGSDGHVASLFPGHGNGDDGLVIPVYDSPKYPPERISMSPTALSNCRAMISIVTGSEKRDAVLRWRQGESLPINTIEPQGGWDILLDKEAWGDCVDGSGVP